MKNNQKPYAVPSNWLIAMLAAIMLQSAPIQAGRLLDPFSSANRNPFVQVFGLPEAESAELTAAHSWQSAVQFEVGNNFSEHSGTRETIIIDGESYRAQLQLRYGLSQDIEVGIEVPYLSHDRGGLDSFIENWHDLWGLPDGGRPAFPQDQLLISYQQDGVERVNISRAADGVGDININMAYQLASTETRQWALRTSVKLPSGEAKQLLGSESTDISLGIHVSDQDLLQNYNISLHGSAGVLWMDSGEVLDQQREDWVFYGSTTLGWLMTSALSLKLQLDAHTAFYDSRLTELGSDSVQLLMGGSIRLSEKWALDLAVSEDIAVNTAPDVVFHLGLKMREWQ
jgi:hypothetical protein